MITFSGMTTLATALTGALQVSPIQYQMGIKNARSTLDQTQLVDPLAKTQSVVDITDLVVHTPITAGKTWGKLLYSCYIADDIFNRNKNLIVYYEAGLFYRSVLFSRQQLFPAAEKNPETAFRVEWSIIFINT